MSKNLLYLIGALFLFNALQKQGTQTPPAGPGDVASEIRDENAAFWARVGSPFDMSGGKLTATPPFIEGISQAPFSTEGVGIGGGFVT